MCVWGCVFIGSPAVTKVQLTVHTVRHVCVTFIQVFKNKPCAACLKAKTAATEQFHRVHLCLHTVNNRVQTWCLSLWLSTCYTTIRDLSYKNVFNAINNHTDTILSLSYWQDAVAKVGASAHAVHALLHLKVPRNLSYMQNPEEKTEFNKVLDKLKSWLWKQNTQKD